MTRQNTAPKRAAGAGARRPASRRQRWTTYRRSLTPDNQNRGAEDDRVEYAGDGRPVVVEARQPGSRCR